MQRLVSWCGDMAAECDWRDDACGRGLAIYVKSKSLSVYLLSIDLSVALFDKGRLLSPASEGTDSLRSAEVRISFFSIPYLKHSSAFRIFASLFYRNPHKYDRVQVNRDTLHPFFLNPLWRKNNNFFSYPPLKKNRIVTFGR